MQDGDDGSIPSSEPFPVTSTARSICLIMLITDYHHVTDRRVRSDQHRINRRDNLKSHWNSSQYVVPGEVAFIFLHTCPSYVHIN